jgi:hypothetical protein
MKVLAATEGQLIVRLGQSGNNFPYLRNSSLFRSEPAKPAKTAAESGACPAAAPGHSSWTSHQPEPQATSGWTPYFTFTNTLRRIEYCTRYER